MEEKKCPVCGEKFACIHSSECWCNGLKLSEKVLEYLKKNYQNCLCKNCLTNIANKFDEISNKNC